MALPSMMLEEQHPTLQHSQARRGLKYSQSDPTWIIPVAPDDIGPWSDAELCSKIGVSVEELKAGHKLSALPSSARSSHTGGISRRTTPTHAQAQVASSLGRAESGASDEFAPPAGSGIDLGSRRFSGVPEQVIAETIRRYAASQPLASSGSDEMLWNGGGGGEGAAGGGAGATGAAAGARGHQVTLMDRVVALERVLPEAARQARRAAAAGGENGAAGGAGRSTRSAAEGSLLHRVEVLEEAIAVLLSAQDVSAALQQQIQQQQQQQLQKQQQQSATSGCCVIM